jgi:hypothetical protein
MVDTVTDDPHRLGADDDRRGRAPGRGDAGFGQRVVQELRAAPTQRAEPLAGLCCPDDH